MPYIHHSETLAGIPLLCCVSVEHQGRLSTQQAICFYTKGFPSLMTGEVGVRLSSRNVLNIKIGVLWVLPT